MNRKNGTVVVRYFLVGVLVAGMAVDSAAARRLFQRQTGCRKCPTKCVSACCTACPVISSEAPCDGPDSAIVADSPCAAIETTAADSTCQGCAAETQPAFLPDMIHETIPETIIEETIIEETIVPVPVPVESFEPADEYVPAEATASPIAPPSYQPALPPAPLAVPEASEIAPPPATPVVEEHPTAEAVGDRYSNQGDLFGPAKPADSPVPTPVPPPADAGAADLFDEPTAPAEEDDTPEGPLPEPQPEPESDVDDLFGPVDSMEPTEPVVAFEPDVAEEPDVVEENEEEPAEQPLETEQPSSEPDASDSEDEGFDPFGEDLTTRLENQTSVLEVAGGLQSDSERTWTDNTATFECQARLLHVTAKNVVIEQSTGAKLVVPLARLANSDLQFVREQITALGVVRARDAAAANLAVAWAK